MGLEKGVCVLDTFDFIQRTIARDISCVQEQIKSPRSTAQTLFYHNFLIIS